MTDPPEVTGQVPAADLDAEAVVLSHVLVNSEAFASLGEIRAEHFFSDANRLIWAAVESLNADGLAADPVAIKRYLADHDQFGAVGGASYLSQLVAEIPATVRPKDHVGTIVACWQLRRMVAACQRVAAEGYTTAASEAPRYLAEAMSAVFAAGHDEQEGPGLVSAADGVKECWELRKQDHVHRIATGLHDLDTRLLLRPGGLTVLAGRPGMGKTALGLGMAVGVCQQDETAAALVFSLEMTRHEVLDRGCCALCDVNVDHVLRNAMSGEEQAKLVRGSDALSKLPLWIDDCATLTTSLIRTRVRLARQLAEERGCTLRLVVLDYLQLMRGRRGARREEQIAELSRFLKLLAKDQQIHVLAMSQLNREVEKRIPPRPILADIRESGAVEQDADAIVLLYRPEYYRQLRGEPCPGDERGMCHVHIAKQRSGPTGRVKLRFWATYTRFEDLGQRDLYEGDDELDAMEDE